MYFSMGRTAMDQTATNIDFDHFQVLIGSLMFTQGDFKLEFNLGRGALPSI